MTICPFLAKFVYRPTRTDWRPLLRSNEAYMTETSEQTLSKCKVIVVDDEQVIAKYSCDHSEPGRVRGSRRI